MGVAAEERRTGLNSTRLSLKDARSLRSLLDEAVEPLTLLVDYTLTFDTRAAQTMKMREDGKG